MYYLAYEVGAIVLRVPTFSFDQFSELFSIEKAMEFGAPLLIGCFILMNVGAFIGYYGINYLWRRSILHKMELRKFRDANLNSSMMARETCSTYKKFLAQRYHKHHEGKD